MKKKIILMTLLTLTLSLMGCSRRGSVRTNSLAPSGSDLSNDVAIAKLGAAYKATMSKENISYSLNETSDPLPSLSFDSIQKDTYTDGTDPVTYTRSVSFSSLSISGAVSGLASSKVSDLKMATKTGFAANTSFQTNDKDPDSRSTTGIETKEYVSGSTLYIDSNTKLGNFIVKIILGLGFDLSTLVQGAMAGLIGSKYQTPLALTDENMPLIDDNVLGYVDTFISTLNSHSSEYSDFLKGYTLSDGTYAVYLSMVKEDVIKVAHDVVDDVKDNISSLSVDSSTVDKEFENLTVRSLEFLVNFSDSAILSCSSNFDLDNVADSSKANVSSIIDKLTSSSAPSSSSSSSSSNKGTSTFSYTLKGNMGFSFGNEAPVIPSETELAAYKDLKSTISSIIGSLTKK